MKVSVANLQKGFINLLKLSLLAFGGVLIFFGMEIILSGYIMFGDSFESRWGYLFLFIASVFVVIGGIIMFFFLAHGEDEYVQKYRDVYPTYESIYYSPASSLQEKKIEKGEKEKIDVAADAKEEEKTPIDLGYTQSTNGNVLAYSNPFYTMMDNPELAGMAAINPMAPYTPKAGEEKKENLILPHPIWLAILFGIALVGGMMCFYTLTRYGFHIAVFFMIDITFILCVLLPPFIWLAFLARLTKKNPIKMRTIYLVFGLGILSAVPALFINTLFGYHMGRDFAVTSSAIYSAVILTAIIAPFNEEFCKALGLVFLREKLDTPMYGFIFGMTIGLGFSMVENANYEFFVLWQSFHFSPPYDIYMDENVHFSWGLVTFGRSVVGPIVHGLGVGLVGYATAYARERKKLAYLAIPLAYLFAVFIHGLWNGGNVYLSGSFLALFNIYLVIVYLLIIMVVLYHLWKGKPLMDTVNRLFKREVKGRRSKGKGKNRPKPSKG